MKPVLQPCPFCGSDAKFSFSSDGDLVNARCENWSPGECLGAGPNCYTKSEAAERWNRRVQREIEPWPMEEQPDGTVIPVDPSEMDLPGMWEQADFTGGDPDERSYHERERDGAAQVPEGFVLVPGYRCADDIVTALYRRFKRWSEAGFGPDDVTWCEVKADIMALIDGSPSAPPRAE